MNTFSTHSQRNINTVVDDQRDTMALGDLVQLRRGGDENTGVTLLVTILDNGNTYKER